MSTAKKLRVPATFSYHVVPLGNGESQRNFLQRINKLPLAPARPAQAPVLSSNQANTPMKKLTKRTIASRANGKLSPGPTSAAGKLRASANSTRHGLLADNLVLDGESKEVFAVLHQQYIDRFNPTDGIEVALVEDLAATTWRQHRLLVIESTLLNQAAVRQPGNDFVPCLAGAFSELSRGPELHLIDRYESRLHRQFQRTLKNIQLIREIERTEPSSGELTQLPPEATAEIDELPNGPRSEQPPAESAAYPTTSNTVSEPAGGTITENLANPTELGNLAATTETGSIETESVTAQSETGGADFSLPPAGATLPLLASTPETHELPDEPRSSQPPAESNVYPITSIPKSEPPTPTPAPPKPEPADRYEVCGTFSVDPRTGALKRIA